MRVLADVFPAKVALAPPDSLDDITELMPSGAAPQGTRRVDRCRVVVMSNKIMIAVDSPTGHDVVFSEAIVDYKKDGGIHRVVTETRKILAFRKDDNCGCGSKLRTWNPYGSILTVGGED